LIPSFNVSQVKTFKLSVHSANMEFGTDSCMKLTQIALNPIEHRLQHFKHFTSCPDLATERGTTKRPLYPVCALCAYADRTCSFGFAALGVLRKCSEVAK